LELKILNVVIFDAKVDFKDLQLSTLWGTYPSGYYPNMNKSTRFGYCMLDITYGSLGEAL
jgi:hypothetical protein